MAQQQNLLSLYLVDLNKPTFRNRKRHTVKKILLGLGVLCVLIMVFADKMAAILPPLFEKMM